MLKYFPFGKKHSSPECFWDSYRFLPFLFLRPDGHEHWQPDRSIIPKGQPVKVLTQQPLLAHICIFIRQVQGDFLPITTQGKSLSLEAQISATAQHHYQNDRPG